MNKSRGPEGNFQLTSIAGWANLIRKRKFTPWFLEKCLERLIGTKPKAIRTLNTTTFTIEVDSVEQSTAMKAITEINGINTEMNVNTTFYKIKGLIYIYGYNMSSFQAFQSKLKEQYGLHEVVEATWIKVRNNNRATPLLLTFCSELP